MNITCKNCGIHFKGKFCPNCSQKATTGRLEVGNVLHEFWHNFTHTDKGYLSLLTAMVKHPGTVIREFIDGRRKKYFNPYTFYLVTTAVLIFITAKVYKYEDALYDYRNEFGQFINAQHNFIVLCSLPFLALLLQLIFFKRKYNYAEWITFLVFSFGLINFSEIVIQLLYFPLIKYHRAYKSVTDILGYIILLYVLISFIQPKKWWQVLQCLLATFVIFYLVEVVASLVALWIYGVPTERLIQMFKNAF